jgi:hypothetical protein
MKTSYRATRHLLLFALALFQLAADPVAVRHPEGLLHGFLTLSDLKDHILATGDLLQYVNGSRVTAELIFHFKDGSLHDETAVYSQRRIFQLIAYRLVQKGPAFKHSIDLSLNAASGLTTVQELGENGKAKTISDHLKLPSDLANGIFTTVLLDIDPSTPKTTLSMVVATPKPRLVKLVITPSPGDSFSLAGVSRKAICYDIKIDLGGVAGVVAPLVGKQPPDIRVWMIPGKAPGFLKMEAPLSEDGPVWRIEMASPVWPKSDK